MEDDEESDQVRDSTVSIIIVRVIIESPPFLLQDAVGLGGSGGLGLGFGGPVPGGGGGETGESPFNNLRDLFCHSAHLTVFLNYVMNSADPASLVSWL